MLISLLLLLAAILLVLLSEPVRFCLLFHRRVRMEVDLVFTGLLLSGPGPTPPAAQNKDGHPKPTRRRGGKRKIRLSPAEIFRLFSPLRSLLMHTRVRVERMQTPSLPPSPGGTLLYGGIYAAFSAFLAALRAAGTRVTLTGEAMRDTGRQAEEPYWEISGEVTLFFLLIFALRVLRIMTPAVFRAKKQKQPGSPREERSWQTPK